MKQSPFPVRGVVEGFYGIYYTPPERDDLVRFLGAHGYNLYIYGPKNDRRHRNRWRDPYTPRELEHFARTIDIARESGVDFCYALSPGVSMQYSSEADFQIIRTKLRAFYDLGVRSFSLLLDDIEERFRYAEDQARYRNYAEAHVDLSNRTHEFLKRHDPACTLSMCPTGYYGVAPFRPYIQDLGAGLCPDIDVFYTGPAICSPAITTAQVRDFAAAVRRPPLLWDNYPVNDLAMQCELHIGPYRNREATLYEAAKGIIVPPMIQAEASKVPLLTLADYLTDPLHYDPDESWERALTEVAGEESAEALRLLAENSLHSCLGGPEAERLEALVTQAVAALERGEATGREPIQALESYLVCLDEACDHLKNRMENLCLRNNLLPWIELLEFWAWTGLRGLAVLKEIERGESFEVDYRFMREYYAAALEHHKRIAGHVLAPFAELVIRRAEGKM